MLLELLVPVRVCLPQESIFACEFVNAELSLGCERILDNLSKALKCKLASSRIFAHRQEQVVAAETGEELSDSIPNEAKALSLERLKLEEGAIVGHLDAHDVLRYGDLLLLVAGHGWVRLLEVKRVCRTTWRAKGRCIDLAHQALEVLDAR